jgi:hypothetical protein
MRPWSAPTVSEIKAAVGYASSGRGEGARDKSLEIAATVRAAAADGVPLDSDEMRERIRKARNRIRSTGGPTLRHGQEFEPAGRAGIVDELSKAIDGALVKLGPKAPNAAVLDVVGNLDGFDVDREAEAIYWRNRHGEKKTLFRTFANRVTARKKALPPLK